MNARIKQKNLYITEQKAAFVYKFRLRSDTMDRRMKKTKKAIYDALKSLLAKESYSKITVSEIIEEADIGRSTFYAHYETKDDLLKEMCHDIFLHIMDTNLTKEETHNFSGNPLRFRTLITHILYHIKEEVINLKGLLEGENGIYFWQNFRLQSQHFIQTYLLQHHRQNTGLPDNVLVNHISVSFEGLVKWWIQNGMKETPEEIEIYFESLIYPILPLSEPFQDPANGTDHT